MLRTATVLDNRLVRLAVALVMMLVFGWSMVQSGRIAIARIFTKYETTVVSTAPADAAAAADNSVAMTPLDAEVHYTRGAVATYRQDTPTALKEYEEAVSLRPRDYYFWVELGLARDDSGDQPGALFAFNEAMKRAPYYSQPRWLRGNLLFRMGRYDEAFDDLSAATKSNPDYLPAFINLAWGAARNDVALTKQLLQIKSEKDEAELGLFLA